MRKILGNVNCIKLFANSKETIIREDVNAKYAKKYADWTAKDAVAGVTAWVAVASSGGIPEETIRTGFQQ